MTLLGYDAARVEGERIARALRAIAALIDAPENPQPPMKMSSATSLGMREDAAALLSRAAELDQGVFQIIVLGEFKNGKSTLLNGMLGSKRLPAKATPATAIITVLVYGTSPEVAIYETGRAEPRTVSWEEFIQEFQLSREDQETLSGKGTVDRFRDVKYAQVEVQHSICASGVKLVDSPGLGEHISRTRVATNFLRKAHAVIFVLNATRVLTQDERDFIDHTLGSGRLPHVFFVVNRINQVDAADVPAIERWVERGLAHHFLDEQGNVDREAYTRRVFFVDARGALEAANEGDEVRREATNVPALERELERFLATDERVAAMLASTLQMLTPIIAQARRRIAQRKSALDQPLQELEERHVQAEQQLRGLEARKGDIERTVLLFGDTIKQKVYANLLSYLDDMRNDWPEDSRHLIDLDRAVSLKNLVTAYAQQEGRERIAMAIEAEVQRYLQIKFGQWAERIPDVIHADVGAMMDEVEAQVDELTLELERIASLFAGVPPPSYTSHGRMLQHLPLFLSEIAGMTDEIIDMGDWSRVISRMAQQALAVLLVSTFLTGNLLIALVLVEAVHLGIHESEVKKRIREGLGERLHANLRQQVAGRQRFIYDAVDQQFSDFARAVTASIQGQIDETRTEQARVLRQKQDEHFSVAEEKYRLDTLGHQLTQLVDRLQTTEPFP